MRTHHLAPLLLALTACVSGGHESGIRIGDKTLEQFKAGKSTERWVFAILGEPTSSAPVQGEDDVHVLRYSLVEEKGGWVSALFGGSSTTTVSTVYFVVRKGVVDSFWADRAVTPGLLGGGETPGEKKD